jgi:hypothetical protein
MQRSLPSILVSLLLSLAIGACGSNNNGGDGSNNNGDGTNNGDATLNDGIGTDIFTGDGPIQVSDAGVTITEDGGTWTCHITSCAGHVLECGDCVDNDGDGRVDSHDQECLGPCDNTERADLLTGVGGETGGPCAADCYFDFGNGPGNDDCMWDHRCDPHEVAPDFYPEGPACTYQPNPGPSINCPMTQSMRCHDFCRPLTPNGCDCFGCCTFPQLAGTGPGGGPGYVWLGSLGPDGGGSCTFDRITDPAACHPCMPVGDCLNDCGPCEVCIGRPMPPPECFPQPSDGGVDVPDAGPPPGMQCPPDLQPCGLPGQAECQFGFYCVSGCCQAAPP